MLISEASSFSTRRKTPLRTGVIRPPVRLQDEPRLQIRAHHACRSGLSHPCGACSAPRVLKQTRLA